MFRNQYDTDVTTWSPAGRLFQVEYAMEAVKQGSAAIGLRSKTHVVLACVNKANSELSSHQKKIFKVDDHIGVAIAGLTADGRVLSRYMRSECINYSYSYESPLPVGRLVVQLADKAQCDNVLSYIMVKGFSLTADHIVDIAYSWFGSRLEAELGNGEAIQNAEAVDMWVVLWWLSRCVCMCAQACTCILSLTSSSGTSSVQNGSFLARSAMVFVTQVCTQRSWKRPYGVGLLIAGLDESGAHLYYNCPSGNYFEYQAFAIGSRSQAAKTYLERKFEKFSGSSRDELLKDALFAIRETLQGEKLTSTICTVAVLGVGEAFQILDQGTVQALIDAFEISGEEAPAEQAAPAGAGEGQGAAEPSGADDQEAAPAEPMDI
ncbi:hypothetical protein LguiB_017188 [Lonicera macranthoides]